MKNKKRFLFLCNDWQHSNDFNLIDIPRVTIASFDQINQQMSVNQTVRPSVCLSQI